MHVCICSGAQPCRGGSEYKGAQLTALSVALEGGSLHESSGGWKRSWIPGRPWTLQDEMKVFQMEATAKTMIGKWERRRHKHCFWSLRPCVNLSFILCSVHVWDIIRPFFSARMGQLDRVPSGEQIWHLLYSLWITGLCRWHDLQS